jgi:ribosomal protein L7Ae-like RNA K-turn-binding protein
MVKARFTKTDGSKIILLGLSAENLRRLPEEPILFGLADVAPELPRGSQLLIMAGETEETIAAEILKMCKKNGVPMRLHE